jgi:formylglycine-generating enzyme required for sulfatase activity
VPAGRELNHPVVGVSWEDAQGFCQWLTEKEIAEGKLSKGLKYRLPTDEEWSWAVGLPTELGATPAEKSGKNSVDFPWGKDYPPRQKVGNYADETFHAKFPQKDNQWIEGYTDGYATTSPVGSFPANAYGLYDMGGNVWQWCEDWFDASHKQHVLRGASWVRNDRGNLLLSYRAHNVPGVRNYNYGFRCVVGVSVR